MLSLQLLCASAYIAFIFSGTPENSCPQISTFPIDTHSVVKYLYLDYYMEDKPKRSITKAASWRVLATLTTILIVYVATGELVLSLGIGAIEVILKLALYYFHERIWDRILWGKARKIIETPALAD